MIPGTHLDPQRTQLPTADKTTARLLFAIAAAHKWPVEHMDITNAYVHEPATHNKSIYVRELADSRGRFSNGKTMGRLLKNLWGGNSAGHDYV